MAKQYKPGQFVWVNGQKCRVTRKEKHHFSGCDSCKRPHPCKALIVCSHIPYNCYPKPI